ncbi:MAG: sulfatase family protein [Bacteroidales bacterium]
MANTGNPQSNNSKPNLVVVMADQWRGSALGFLGKEPVLTPHIDKLAKQGVALTQAVSNYPVSSPARASFMTGQYPNSNGVTGNCNSNSAPAGIELKEDAICWSDILKSKGYTNAYFGKWHLDSPRKPYVDCYNNKGKIAWNEWCPPERRHGFDHWVSYGTYDSHLRPMYWHTESNRDEFIYVNQWGPEYEVGQAIDFIANRDKGTPFALVISMNPPHTPYDAVPEKYKSLYQNLNIDSLMHSNPRVPDPDTPMGKNYKQHIADYYACMSGVDNEVGRLVSYLKQENLFDNTIFVFTSDHGDCLGMHNQVTKNNIYDESMCIPFIITYPDKIKPRIDHKTLISLSDFMPTILSLMDLEEFIPETVESNNLKQAIINGKGNVIGQPYFRYNNDNGENQLITSKGLRDSRYTYELNFNGTEITGGLLFDRMKDPMQLNNIFGKDPKTEKRLRAKLKTLLIKANDPMHSYL